ncbi:MAG: M1 family aminopeptidase [Gemmatales bacterium]
MSTRLSRLLAVSACMVSLAAANAGGVRLLVKQPVPPAKTQETKPSEPLRTPTDRKVNIRHIRLDLKVDVAAKTVVSQAAIDFKTIRAAKTLTLDAVGFEVKKVTLSREGQPDSQAQFTHDGKKLTVELGNGMPAGQTGKVLVEYVVDKPKSGLHFFAPSKANPEAPMQVWSQGQTITNRYWIPCVDEPNQRQTTQVVATVPAGYEAISNGRLLSRKENSDNTVTFDWYQDKPHSSYLITLVVGQFDMVQVDWNGMPVMYYVPKGRKAEAMPTYGKTPEMLTFFSSRFGIPYPWDKYAQLSCYQFGGGMENTSATTMGDGILKDQRSLLDGNSEWIVAHELAHQWWGDLVTCRDWSHTWLNEGFASYAECLWDEHSLGKDGYAMNVYQKLNSAIPAGKARPVMDRRYPNPDSMFDGRSYPKGAFVLHMLRNRLGDEAFFQGIRDYGTTFKFQTVETADFRRSLERTTGRDLERFFYDWLERSGNPELEVTTDFKTDTRQVTIVAKQTQTIDPFHFPLKIALYCKGVADPVIVEEEMKDREFKQTVTLPGVLERVEVDPDLAVLATIKEVKSPELWRAQLQASTVPLRMRAMVQLRNSKDAADREAVLQAYQKEKFPTVKLALGNILGANAQPAGRDALLEGLKDADARIRNNCVLNLSNFKNDEKVVAAIRNIVEKGDPSYAVETSALRTFARLGQKDTLALLTPWLEKPSHQNVLVTAAITGIADLNDPAALESLITWSAPGHPRNCRRIAHRAVVQLVKGKKLSETQTQQALQCFEKVLKEDDQLLHSDALEGVYAMGPAARPVLAVVEKLAETLPAGTLKDNAKKTAEKLKEDPKATAELKAKVQKAKEELEKLQRELEAAEKGKSKE